MIQSVGQGWKIDVILFASRSGKVDVDRERDIRENIHLQFRSTREHVNVTGQ